jgi:hypothetical protein
MMEGNRWLANVTMRLRRRLGVLHSIRPLSIWRSIRQNKQLKNRQLVMMHADQVRHWNLLSAADQEVLSGIRVALSAPSLQNKRNRRVADLREIIDTLKIFQFHSQEDTWKRCLVTGFVELDDSIAINVGQLHTLIYKCKSSINGSLRRMGYSVNVNTVAAFNKLFNVIPALRRNPAELRQWTIRQHSDALPADDGASAEEESGEDSQDIFPFDIGSTDPFFFESI